MARARRAAACASAPLWRETARVGCGAALTARARGRTQRPAAWSAAGRRTIVAVGGAQVTATNVASAGLDAVVVTVSGVRFDRWASRGKPLVGDRVRWFGNPMGEPEVYREGYIAKVSRKGIVVVATICHGDSGSGLINNKGQVVGVVSAMTDRSGCTFVLASP